MSKEKHSDLPEVSTSERRDTNELLDFEGKDPDMHYRWVKDDPMRIARHKMKGYSIVEKGAVTPYVEGDDAADGTIRVGDTILMACPRSRFERRQRQSGDLSEARLSAPLEKAKEKINRKNVRTIQSEGD